MDWLLFRAIVAFPLLVCHQDLMAMKQRSGSPLLLVSIKEKSCLKCPGNPVKNLSVAYDIPDTWQIIGFAPNCYNNQSVTDPRNKRTFCLKSPFTLNRPLINSSVLHLLGHALGLVDEHIRFDRFRKRIHGQNRSHLAKSNVLARRPNFPVKVHQKIHARFIKINNIYAFDDFQQQLVTRIPPNEKLDTPFGYNHLSIMQYSSYS